MYRRILIPVDMNQREKLDRALATAAHLAHSFDAEAIILAVTGKKPHDGSPDISTFEQRVSDFAQAKGEAHGVTFQTQVAVTVDPYSDLNKQIYKACDELDADLIVLASHVPGIKEYILPSTAGAIAKHSDRSVFVVR